MRFMRELAVSAALVCSVASAQAQQMEGQWQGTIHAGGKDLRLVLKVFKEGTVTKADLFSIDQAGGTPIHATSFSVDGGTVKFAVNVIGVSYEGKLSADGRTISGNWTQGDVTPLDFVLSTKETAWEIPAPPPPPKLMAADADPAFDVATIKPNDSGANQMQQLTIQNRDFVVKNGSLEDLLGFAFNVQKKQLISMPDWSTKDRYDIKAVPDTEGAPSVDQLRSMLLKLMVERFGVKYHHEKREMPAFVLTVAKTGSKLTETEVKGPLPGMGFGAGKGGLTLRANNATTKDVATLLQGFVLDRPVVDQTGLTARYDILVTFTPDDSQFNGHPPQIKAEEGVEPAPSLFDAFLQQAGLKLSAEKTMVDVIVIDHAEKPSAN